jgi:excinuclease ABC subunit B
MQFKLSGEYQPAGDQPEAIKKLVKGLKEGKQMQTLLGATALWENFYDCQRH